MSHGSKLEMVKIRDNNSLDGCNSFRIWNGRTHCHIDFYRAGKESYHDTPCCMYVHTATFSDIAHRKNDHRRIFGSYSRCRKDEVSCAANI